MFNSKYGYVTLGTVDIEYPLNFDEVIEGVYLVKCPLFGSVTYVASIIIDGADDGLMLIDTCMSYHAEKYILPFVRMLGKKPEDISIIVNTHSHGDHTHGNLKIKQFSSATIASHKLATERIKGGVDRLLKDGDSLNSGKFLFKIIYTPGYTDDSICLFEPNHKILLSGDAIQGNGSVDQGMPIINHIDCYRESLENILQLDIEHLIPAHQYRGQEKPVLQGNEINSFVNASLEYSIKYETKIVEILEGAAAPLPQYEIQKILLKELTLDQEELEAFYLSFLSVWSRPTIDAYCAQKIPSNLKSRIKDEKWVDTNSLDLMFS